MCGAVFFWFMHALTPYSAVFILHPPAPAPIKINFGAVRWGAVQCDSCSCVDEAYTPIHSISVPA